MIKIISKNKLYTIKNQIEDCLVNLSEDELKVKDELFKFLCNK